MKRLFALPLIAAAFLAHAQAPAPAQEAPAAEIKKLGDKQVPMLTTRWECPGCVLNEKVLPLIEVSYATAATAGGYALSGNETAELVIVAFRQRPPAARVWFGAMAGRDVLTTNVTFRGKTFVAGDYSANVLHGMNSLCEAVGQEALKKIIAALEQK